MTLDDYVADGTINAFSTSAQNGQWTVHVEKDGKQASGFGDSIDAATNDALDGLKHGSKKPKAGEKPEGEESGG